MVDGHGILQQVGLEDETGTRGPADLKIIVVVVVVVVECCCFLIIIIVGHLEPRLPLVLCNCRHF